MRALCAEERRANPLTLRRDAGRGGTGRARRPLQHRPDHGGAGGARDDVRRAAGRAGVVGPDAALARGEVGAGVQRPRRDPHRAAVVPRAGRPLALPRPRVGLVRVDGGAGRQGETAVVQHRSRGRRSARPGRAPRPLGRSGWHPACRLRDRDHRGSDGRPARPARPHARGAAARRRGHLARPRIVARRGWSARGSRPTTPTPLCRISSPRPRRRRAPPNWSVQRRDRASRPRARA